MFYRKFCFCQAHLACCYRLAGAGGKWRIVGEYKERREGITCIVDSIQVELSGISFGRGESSYPSNFRLFGKLFPRHCPHCPLTMVGVCLSNRPRRRIGIRTSLSCGDQSRKQNYRRVANFCPKYVQYR